MTDPRRPSRGRADQPAATGGNDGGPYPDRLARPRVKRGLDRQEQIERAIERASSAAVRAHREGQVAERHERLSDVTSEAHRRLHEKRAVIHRNTQARHLALMELCCEHAFRMTDRLIFS